ncbi:MAG TPA: hypothetical protein VJ436_01490 [Anaerolineales bacterium]|nr:hypothetical protein [Anaerolineales bacterium]
MDAAVAQVLAQSCSGAHVAAPHGPCLRAANAYLFLCSDEAAFITEMVLSVDGGFVAGCTLRKPGI